MRLVVYGDCIPADPVSLDESKRYPGLIASAFKELEVSVLDYSGMTTLEMTENIKDLLERKPDIVILNWGLNDALPRGLKRINRSRAIRAMYKLKMGKGMRLFCRTYLLNPMEYLLQFVHKPRFYYTREQTCEHFKYIIDTLRENNINKIVISAINPIMNYRFRNANAFIKLYNDSIYDFCLKEEIPYADVYTKCLEAGLERTMGLDEFHYSEYGHSVAAGEIIKILTDSYLKQTV